MARRLSRFWAVILALLLAIVSPITAAWQRVFHSESIKTDVSAGAADALAASALAFTVLPPPVGPPEPELFDVGPTEIFINGLLVLDSSVGLATDTLPAVDQKDGVAYSVESYIRVSLAAPEASDMFVRGVAVAVDGSMRIYDSSLGLPADVFWQGGLPVTPSGQLCVVFG
jgi:hypothetical protein